jgi:histidinol-phosphate aminotransferase
MDHVRAPRELLSELVPYDAREVECAVKLASNENPRNLPPEIMRKLARGIAEFDFNRYPDPMANKLRRLIADANGLEPANVLIGNGGDELIFNLLMAWGGPGRNLLDMPPTFAMYAIDGQVTGTRVNAVPRLADFTLDEAALLARAESGVDDVVVISNPNNPTGTIAPETVLIDVLNATDAIVLVDEAYFEFSRTTMRPHLERHRNLVILRTFSKAFSLAGMRVGYLLGHEDVVREIAKVRQPYSVDGFSQMVARLVFRERAVFEQVISEIIRNRDALLEELGAMEDVTVYPSEANFVLFHVPDAASVWRDLLHEHSVLLRDLSRQPGLEDHLRVTVGTEQENDRFLDGLTDVLMRHRAARRSAASSEAQNTAKASPGGEGA